MRNSRPGKRSCISHPAYACHLFSLHLHALIFVPASMYMPAPANRPSSCHEGNASEESSYSHSTCGYQVLETMLSLE